MVQQKGMECKRRELQKKEKERSKEIERKGKR
jgi:hypothetical protein